jgi:hypothetical protein
MYVPNNPLHLPTSSRNFGDPFAGESKAVLESHAIGSGHYFEESVHGSLRVIPEASQLGAQPNPMNQTMPNASPDHSEFEVKLLEQEKLSLVASPQTGHSQKPQASRQEAIARQG